MLHAYAITHDARVAASQLNKAPFQFQAHFWWALGVGVREAGSSHWSEKGFTRLQKL